MDSPYRRNKGLCWPQCTLLKLAVHWPVHLCVAKRSERNRVSGAVIVGIPDKGPGTFLRVARDTTRASAVKGFVFPTRLLDEAGPLWGKEFDIVVV